MRIEELMTRNVACCTPDTRLQDVANMMIDCHCGVVPVIENQNNQRLVGVVTDRDIVCRLIAQGRNPLDARASDAMTAPVLAVNPDTDVQEAIQLMEQHQVRRLPVCDSGGRCIGIISQADIARRLSEHDTAELVRHISEPTEAAHA